MIMELAESQGREGSSRKNRIQTFLLEVEAERSLKRKKRRSGTARGKRHGRARSTLELQLWKKEKSHS